MHRRRPTLPSVSFSPRSQVLADSYSVIDSVLKQLKKCSRRAQIVFTAHREELQILERLYYKGKNQHRSALFWKRVVETKRYASRVEEMDIASLLEDLRSSFYGQNVPSNSKVTKGPWTHIPNAPVFSSLLERLCGAKLLLGKMCDRLTAAYQCMTLAMQSGAFIQMTLVLAGIISRMHALIPEMQEVVQESCDCIQQATESLYPIAARKTQTLRRKAPVEVPAVAGQPPIASTLSDLSMEADEDVGHSITRVTIPSIRSPPPPTPKPDWLEQPGHYLEDEIPFSTVIAAPPNIARSVVDRNPKAMPDPPKRVPATEPEKRTKKKRKKKDEIDDIFG